MEALASYYSDEEGHSGTAAGDGKSVLKRSAVNLAPDVGANVRYSFEWVRRMAGLMRRSSELTPAYIKLPIIPSWLTIRRLMSSPGPCLVPRIRLSQPHR